MKGPVKKPDPLGTSAHSTDNQVTLCYENQDSSVGRKRFDHATPATLGVAGREMDIPSSVITSKMPTVVSALCFPVKYHSFVFPTLNYMPALS